MNEFYSSFLNQIDLNGKSKEYSKSPGKWRKRSTKVMGFALVFLLSILGSFSGIAQSTANYAFSTATNGSLALDANGNAIDMSTGTTQLVGGSSDSGASPVTNIGFNFTLMSNNYSQFSASADGMVGLGSVGISGATYSSASTTTPRISAFGGDLYTGSNGKVHYKMVGTAPNRCLVVEFTNMAIFYSTDVANALNTYQVRLYETSNAIEYVYGNMYVGSISYPPGYVGFAVGTTAGKMASILTSSNTLSTSSPFSTNTYPAATNIPNLHSTANGSRRVYSFVPATVVTGDVANLTFSAISANETTLNWDDNATNESSFVITRATDAAFTQNVTNSTVVSTTSAGTGTSYSSIQTGLGAGNTYYYKISAFVEGGQSVGITGSSTTLFGSSYYWTGVTGGTWNTFANWNTAADGTGAVPTVWANSDVYIIDGEGTTAGGALAISVDRASFTVGQIQIVNNTNLTLASSATTTRTITISGGPGDDFLLEAGSSLNLVSPANAIAIAFAGAGNTGLIGGNYTAGGSTSNVLTTSGGAGTLVTVSSTGVVTSTLNSTTGAIVGSLTSLLFKNGSNYVHSNSTTSNYIPTAEWEANATATLNGNTTGTSLTSSSTSLGNLVVNTTLSTATFSAFTSAQRTIKGNLTINSTGTGRFRAITSGILTVNGNLIVNGGIFEVGSSTGGGVIVKGNTTIASGATLDVGQSTLQNEGNVVNNGSILSSETTTTNSTFNFLGSGLAQTFSGSGTFTGRVSSFGISNPLGLTLSTPVLTQRVNLFAGLITGSANVTIGTGAALTAAVQIGSATNTTPGGTFDVSPIYNLGTGVYTVIYQGETTSRITGFEVPPTRVVNNLSVSNANGLTIAGGIINVYNTLTLTSGIVTTSTASHIIHGTSTAAGTLTGGSLTSYINGPIVRVINDANAAFILFPVGKSNYSPISLAPTTTSVVAMSAEAFDSNTGTANASIVNLSANRRWAASVVSGTFTNVKVRLTDALISSTNIPVQAATAAGAYTSSFGSTAIFTAGTPNMIESNFAANAADFTGFISFADSNTCMGTPAPGNTIASSMSICLGESVNLSLQNIIAGSGITYQWKSSTDGITYTEIAGATGSSLSVTPSVSTYYLADVNCPAGPSTGTSTAVYVSFSNSVATTTPAARCGVGSVTLAATPSAGATINWYTNPTGGISLGAGNSFTTPSIGNTTTYFAGASTSNPANVTIGTGTTLTSTTAQNSVFCNYWGTGWRQMIYSAAELNAAGLSAGNITSIAFTITSLPISGTVNSFAVRLGAAASTTVTSTFATTGLDLVFGPLNYTPIIGVNTLTLATPYNWDGVSNIIVDIRENGAYDSANSATIATNTATVSVVHGYASGSAPSPAYYTSNPTGVTTTLRPNIIFSGQLACASGRVPVVATVTTPPILTLSVTDVTICNASTSSAVTITSNAADYDTYVWSPAEGVSGNSTLGWTFNPTATTSYTLTASQSTGNLCASSVTLNVTVNVNPAAIVFSPIAPQACVNVILPLSFNGGTLGTSGKIGTGVAVNTASTPYKGYFGGAKTQSLYTAAELTAVGVVAGQKITSIGFVALSGTPNVLNGFTINAGFVSATTLGSSFIGGASNVVIAPSAYTAATGAGNLDYVLSTPLLWDGVSNLLVETCFNNNNSGGAAANSISVQSSTVAAGLHLYLSGDNNPNICSSGGVPTSATNRPNLRVTSLQNTLIVWSPTTDLFSDAAATVLYVNGDNASTVYFKSSTVGSNNYTVSATTELTCSVSGSVSVTVNALPTLVVSNVSALCNGGTANLTASSVTTGSSTGLIFTYFSDAAATIAVSNPAAVGVGTYYIKGTSAAGCSSIASVIVTEPTAIAISMSVPTNVTCNGGTNGSATVTATGGTSPYTYLWSNGSTTAMLSGVAAGTYTVTVTDANGCSMTSTATITEPTAIAVAISTPINATCNGGTNGSAMVTATGGTSPYTYLWSNGSTTSTLSGVGAGIYTATVTDAVGCSMMTTVTITEPTALVATATDVTNVSCNGDSSGAATATVTGGTSPYTYLWSNGATTATISGLTAGTYTATITDANLCTTTVTAMITQGSAVMVMVTNPAAACGGTVDITAAAVTAGSDSGLTFAYFTDAAATLPLTNASAITTSGVFYIKGTSAAGCTAVASVTVVINNTLAPTGTAIQDFNLGQTLADFTVVGQNIVWYSDATGSTVLPTSTPLVSGVTYFATQTVNGCESSTRLAVTAGVDLKTPAFEISNLRYYPNPVQSVLTVEYSYTIEGVQMYNMLGQLVYNRKTNASKVTIEMTSMAAGNYILQVTVKGITKNVKVIKK